MNIITNEINILIGFSYNNDRSKFILYKYCASVNQWLSQIKKHTVKIHCIVHNEESKLLTETIFKQINTKFPFTWNIYIKPDVELIVPYQCCGKWKEGAFYRFLWGKLGINCKHLTYFDWDVLIDSTFEQCYDNIFTRFNEPIAAYKDCNQYVHRRFLTHPYCCSGVIHFNCEYFKEKDFWDDMKKNIVKNYYVIKQMQKVNLLLFADQHIMNLYFNEIKVFDNNFKQYVNGILHDTKKDIVMSDLCWKPFYDELTKDVKILTSRHR